MMEQIALTESSFSPPTSLRLPRLYVTIRTEVQGLKKTTANFIDLLTDSKQLKSKRNPNPPLRYVGAKVFRIEEEFVAQTGDVTRQDGSGGESICTHSSIASSPRLCSFLTKTVHPRWWHVQRREGRPKNAIRARHDCNGEFWQEL